MDAVADAVVLADAVMEPVLETLAVPVPVLEGVEPNEMEAEGEIVCVDVPVLREGGKGEGEGRGRGWAARVMREHTQHSYTGSSRRAGTQTMQTLRV